MSQSQIDNAAPAGLGVLVVDDDESVRAMLLECLAGDGHVVTLAGGGAEALSEATRHAFDLIFLNLRLGDSSGLDLIPRLLAESPWAMVVVITAFASIDSAVEAIKRGASDYLSKPVSIDRLRRIAQQCARRRDADRHDDESGHDPDADLPAASSAMRRVLDVARKVAPSNATLLITGEVGVGKTRLARWIHRHSGRAESPCEVACCQQPSAEHFEAELFGAACEPGASAEPCPGRVSACQGGTLVLCEIGDVPISLQPRLLRLLGDKEFERQNDFRPCKADVRVITTSSVDLQEAVQRGSFRAELLLAVDVVDMEIPPLRSRVDDIRYLAERYLAWFAQQHGRSIFAIDPGAMDCLLHHRFPGNERELRNLIERAVLLCDGDTLGREHFSLAPKNGNGCSVGDLVPLETVTDQHIRRVLASTHSLEAAAAVLGINPSTLWRRRKRYGF